MDGVDNDGDGNVDDGWNGLDWSRMDADHAMLAYGLSLAAIDIFYQDYSNYGIANLLRNPERLGDITADLDRRLGL